MPRSWLDIPPPPGGGDSWLSTPPPDEEEPKRAKSWLDAPPPPDGYATGIEQSPDTSTWEGIKGAVRGLAAAVPFSGVRAPIQDPQANAPGATVGRVATGLVRGVGAAALGSPGGVAGSGAMVAADRASQIAWQEGTKGFTERPLAAAADIALSGASVAVPMAIAGKAAAGFRGAVSEGAGVIPQGLKFFATTGAADVAASEAATRAQMARAGVDPNSPEGQQELKQARLFALGASIGGNVLGARSLVPKVADAPRGTELGPGFRRIDDTYAAPTPERVAEIESQLLAESPGLPRLVDDATRARVAELSEMRKLAMQSGGEDRAVQQINDELARIYETLARPDVASLTQGQARFYGDESGVWEPQLPVPYQEPTPNVRRLFGRSKTGPSEVEPRDTVAQPAAPDVNSRMFDDTQKGEPYVGTARHPEGNQATQPIARDQADIAGKEGDPFREGQGQEGRQGLLEPSEAPRTGAEAPAPVIVENAPYAEFPVDQIRLSADVPNFKAGANKNGVVDPLTGTVYRRLPIEPIVLWRRTNGNHEVITGRHRLDLARRLGEKTIPAQIVDESAGFTRDQALILDAEHNIQQGQGTIEDYANYFRHTQATEEQLRQRGVLGRAKADTGFALGRYASDNLWQHYISGSIPEAQAAAIASGAPGNELVQNMAISLFQREPGSSPEKLKAYAQFRSRHPLDVSQTDLLGDVVDTEGELLAEVAARKRRELLDQIRVAKAGLNIEKKGDSAARVGVQVKTQGKTTHDKMRALQAEAERWDNWHVIPELADEARRLAGLSGNAPTGFAGELLEQPSQVDDIFGANMPTKGEAAHATTTPEASGEAQAPTELKPRQKRGSKRLFPKNSKGFVGIGPKPRTLTPDQAHVESRITYKDLESRKGRLLNPVERIQRDAYDDLVAIKKAGEIAGTDMPYIHARTLRGVEAAQVDAMVTGFRDYHTGKVVSPSLVKEVLDPVGDNHEAFNGYLLARHVPESEAAGKVTGVDPLRAQRAARDYERQYPEFKKAADALQRWKEAALDFAKEAGLYSDEQIEAMRAAYNEHVPLKRFFESEELADEFDEGLRHGISGIREVLKKRVGSERLIRDPLQSSIDNAMALYDAAFKNRVMREIAALEGKPGMDGLVKSVPKGTLNAVRYKESGKIKHLLLDRDLKDAVTAMSPQELGVLSKLLTPVANVLRSGQVLHVAFTLRNIIRDNLNTAVISRARVVPFEPLMRGIFAKLARPELYSEWRAFGGEQSIEAGYRDYKDFAKEHLGSKPRQLFRSLTKHPLAPLAWISRQGEEATRLGVYQKMRDSLVRQGKSVREAGERAAFEARDLLDFQIGGRETRRFKGPAAFFGSAMAGTLREARAFREAPMKTTIKGLAYLTVPTIINYAMNRDDPDYWKASQVKRDIAWRFEVGGKEVWVPKPPGIIGYMFTVPFERALQFMDQKDPKALDRVLSGMLSQLVPNPVPTALRAPFEVAANYSFYGDRPIESESLQRRPPELRYDERTSLLSRNLASKLKEKTGVGISPVKVDYLIRSFTGSGGQYLNNTLGNAVISKATGQPVPHHGDSIMRWFWDTPRQSDAVGRFYEHLADLRQERERRRQGLGRTNVDLSKLPRMERASRAISDLRKRMEAATDEAHKNALFQRIDSIATRFAPLPEGAKGPLPPLTTKRLFNTTGTLGRR